MTSEGTCVCSPRRKRHSQVSPLPTMAPGASPLHSHLGRLLKGTRCLSLWELQNQHQPTVQGEGAGLVGWRERHSEHRVPGVAGWWVLTDSPSPGPAPLLAREAGRGVTLCPHPPPGDSLQALQALVHHQGLRQGLGASIANAVTGEPAREGMWVEQLGGVRPGGVRVREPSREGLSLVSRGPSTQFLLPEADWQAAFVRDQGSSVLLDSLTGAGPTLQREAFVIFM